MLDFWFDFASPYSYVGALRIEAAARVAGQKVQWKPFLLGPIFTAQLGIKDSPFNQQPVRGRYMWRDVERLCSKYGFPFTKPSVFPQKSVLPARVVCASMDQPWVGDFVRAAFRAEFGQGQDLAQSDVVAGVLKGLAIDPGPVLEAAGSEPIKAKLRTLTDEAMALDIFGAPNVVVNGELFFGQDRIDDALAWAAKSA